jgi:1-acyl-sn-glycerol-3-phosphate acyltransferase
VSKHAMVLRLARRYARRVAARELDGVFVSGLADVRGLLQQGPLLLAPNHVCFWDVFALVLLDEALDADGYVLMDQTNLDKQPYFGWLGALPLDVEGGVASRHQLQHAASLLRNPRRALWIFPQGEQRPSHRRPLGFKPGLRLLWQRAKCPVVPVSIAYLYRDAPRPSLWVHFGAPLHSHDPKSAVASVESAVAQGLDAIDAAFDDKQRASVRGYEVLVPASGASPEQGVAARWLGAWARWRGAAEPARNPPTRAMLEQESEPR